jgi:hypothetical protein
LTHQVHATDSQFHRFARDVEDGNRRGEKGGIAHTAENCACSAPPACWQLIGSPRGARFGRPRCIRTLVGTKSMAGLNVTAGRPGAHPCRRSDDLLGRIAMSFPFGWCTVSLLQSPPWRTCTRTAPYSPASRYLSPGRANVAAHRAPSAATPRRRRPPKWNLRNPTLLSFAIPRCSSLQYQKMLAAR